MNIASDCVKAIVAAVVILVTTAATAFSAPAAAPAPPVQGSLTFDLRDGKDNPVGGVVITLEAEWLDTNARGGAMAGGKLVASLRPGAPKVSPSDGNGNLVVPAKGIFSSRQPAERSTGVFFIQQQRRLGAYLKVKPSDTGTRIRVTLEPLVFVHGEVDSPDMEGKGHLMKRANAQVTISLNQVRTVVAKSTSENGRFGVLLPAGVYDLTVSGLAEDGATYAPTRQPIEVKVDKTGEMDLGAIHLPSSKLSALLGKPAPELDGLIEWRNGEPVTLKELRGKVVILDFWSYACSICIHEMPELFPIQQQYKDDLVVIAIHSPIADTLAEAYEKCAGMRKRSWPNGDVPFRVALDGKRSVENRDGGVMTTYGVNGVPTALLIDRDGVLVQRFAHGGMPGFREAVSAAVRKPASSDNTKR